MNAYIYIFAVLPEFQLFLILDKASKKQLSILFFVVSEQLVVLRFWGENLW